MSKHVQKTADGRLLVSKEAAVAVGMQEIGKIAKDLRVAKELDDAADRWLAKANSLQAPTSELKRYYVDKARNARAEAAKLREGTK